MQQLPTCVTHWTPLLPAAVENNNNKMKRKKRERKNENARANIEPYMETETNNKQGPNVCMEIAIHMLLYLNDSTPNFFFFSFQSIRKYSLANIE